MTLLRLRLGALLTAVPALALGGVSAAPSDAAPAPHAQVGAASDAASRAASAPGFRTRYTCSSPYGGGTTPVTFVARFPGRVAQGATVGARPVSATVVVPPKLVSLMRTYGIRSLSGTGSKVAVRIGATKVPVNGVRVPTTRVPASGAMRLVATGTSTAFTLNRLGAQPIKVPAAFGMHVIGTTSSGSRVPVDLTCSVAKGAPVRSGTITVHS